MISYDKTRHVGQKQIDGQKENNPKVSLLTSKMWETTYRKTEKKTKNNLKKNRKTWVVIMEMAMKWQFIGFTFKSGKNVRDTIQLEFSRADNTN